MDLTNKRLKKVAPSENGWCQVVWYSQGVANNSNSNIYQKKNQQLNEIQNTGDNIHRT